MILPLVPPSPTTPARGTAAIRCTGRSIGGTDFEALLAQAGQIGSDIATLLGGSVATATPAVGEPAGAAAGSSGGAARALAGLAVAEANGGGPTGATAASPAAEHAAAGTGQPTPAGVSLPPGLAARLADGRLSPDSLPGRHGDAHPGHDIDGRTGRPATVPAPPASLVPPATPAAPASPAAPAAPATPAAGAETGVAPATSAAPAVPAVPAEPGGLPASEVPSELAAAPAVSRRDAAPALDARIAAPDRLGAEPVASTPVGGPVGPHVAAASEAPETAAALPVRIAELARRRSGTTEQVVVRLDPPELGSVRISLTARGDQVHVVVRADTPEARAALGAQRGNVEQLLRGEGFDLNSFDVDHQRRGHEEHGSRRAGPQTRFAAHLLDLPDPSVPTTDGALRL